ncbi:MAG: helicase-associated domain-containing protein [Microbacterium sp.]|uniref:helicase-associated domain-containing protein n=1 Tax=Microbacterium sp. TaxID=51671 RepID=UPI0019BE9E89|nr:helicase-associated domain-containing protein [Microbacterium sp.]MBD3758936.1 helicase-associated domain-containing protein [Microbacterium sp.]
MTATDARSLAHDLLQRDDASLVALLVARGVSPTVTWSDAFDAAEALLESASAERAVVTVTAVEADALAAAIRGAEPEAIAAGAVRDALYARALVDPDGVPYPAIADAVRGQVPTDAAAAGPAPGTGSDAVPATGADAAASRDAAAAEQAFASSGSLSDILHTALAAPLSRIGTGALGATERRRLIESGAVGDADAADELVEIAARAGLLAGQDRHWLVTAAGVQWLRTGTVARWTEVAAALRAHLPAAVRTSAGGWLSLDRWAGAHPFDPTWPQRAHSEAALLRRWGMVAPDGEAPRWAAPLAAGSAVDTDALQMLLPTEVDRVYLQNDLTAIAPGPLQPQLDVRLRSMARRESRAQASTYRFTPDTLADALTAGETAETLRAFLEELSLTGLPQPLAYEIERTARRHGTLRVGPDVQGRTRVTSDDEALLRTIAVDQALRPLGLVRDGADLVSRSGADTAFWMLADARYPVVAVDADGARRRLDRHRLADEPPAASDPLAVYGPLLARLRAAQGSDAEAAWLGRELEQAVRARATIVVAVRLPDGTAREFTIEATGLGGGRLRGLDKMVDVERTLPVSSISGIRPA